MSVLLRLQTHEQTAVVGRQPPEPWIKLVWWI
jgi:hypothetical protein